ncbi:hypothetical protein LCGC14_2399200, partial [marine sediment metagenome]
IIVDEHSGILWCKCKESDYHPMIFETRAEAVTNRRKNPYLKFATIRRCEIKLTKNNEKRRRSKN